MHALLIIGIVMAIALVVGAGVNMYISTMPVNVPDTRSPFRIVVSALVYAVSPLIVVAGLVALLTSK